MSRVIFLLTALVYLTWPAYAEDKSGVKPSVLSLPSGPGSIEGLGESFEPQLNSGVGQYSVPLKLLPGRAGFQPGLSLQYNAGYGNGVLGVGWALKLPYLQRQTDKRLPFYTDHGSPDEIDNDRDGTTDEADEFDVIVHSNGEELIPLNDKSYRFENEGEFTKFLRIETGGWSAYQKDGTLLRFGVSENSKVADSSGRIYRWLLEDMTDTNGNVIEINYSKLDETYQRYPATITYNVDMSVEFEYETRPDVIEDYRPRFRLMTQQRLASISMKRGENLVRRYALAYEDNTDQQPVSLLRSVQQFGADNKTSLPPATFTYTGFDGTTAEPVSIPNAPGFSLNEGAIDLYDVNADGLPDILDTRDDVHDYYLNKGPNTSGVVEFSSQKGMATNDAGHIKLSSANVQLADMNGNSKSDILQVNGSDVQVFSIKSENGGYHWKDAGLLTQAGFNFQNTDTKLIDLNNDKLIDVLRINGLDTFAWLNQKSGRWSDAFEPLAPASNLSLNQADVRFADMNGDRLQDLIKFGDSYVIYYANKGFGEFAPGVSMDNAPFDYTDSSKILFYDINGDGLADALYVGAEVKVWMNLGFKSDTLSAGKFANPYTVSAPFTNGQTTFRQADINGNGSTDLLWNTSPGGGEDTFAYIDFAPKEQAYQLKTISNGIGRTTTISYRSSTEDYIRDREAGRPWPNTLPFPVSVIAKIEVNDGLTTYTTEMVYHDGYYDGVEKEFRGFESAEQIEVGDNSAPSLVSAFLYDTGASIEALKGKPLTLQTKNIQGDVFYQEDYIWETKALFTDAQDLAMVTFPFQSQRTRTVSEKGQGTPVQLRWTYLYDDYGNQTQLNELGRLDSGWLDERITNTTYTSSCEKGLEYWILSKPLTNEVTDANGIIASKSNSHYDKGIACDFSKGNLTQTDNWVSEETYISEKRDYDQWGNVTAIYDPLYGTSPGHYRTIEYDPDYSTFPISETIFIDDTNKLMTLASYDLGFGTVSSSTDFNNHTTNYAYDTYARLISITKPLDTLPTLEYDYVLAHPLGNGQTINWVETRQRESANGGTVDSRKFYDGLSRLVMTRSEGETAGQIVVSDTVQFNARKTPAKNYLPYFETGTLDYKAPTFTNNFTTHTYDALGREIKMVQPDGSFSQTLYEPLVKTIKDEEQTNSSSPHFGAAMSYEEDGLLNKDGAGRLRKVTELMPEPWVTQYRYDVLDNLTGYTDSQGNQKHIEYDGLSRKTFMNDPDRGHMNYSYDDASNLIQTIDAKQQTIDYTYDGVNRLLTESYKGSASPAVKYHYDEAFGAVSPGQLYGADVPQSYITQLLAGQDPGQGADANSDGKFDVADIVKLSKTAAPTLVAANTLGQLAWVEDEAGQEHYSYDERARKVWSIRQIEEGANTQNYYTGMDYDSMDRVTRLSYPDRSYVDYQFNSRGFLESVPNIINAYDYNPSGQNKALKLNNGTNTAYTYDKRLRLDSLKTTRAQGTLELQHLSYSYDFVSNITQIDDLRSTTALNTIGSEIGLNSVEAQKYNAKQNFSYDNLYRLTQAKNDSVYGSVSYAYDQIGNMINKNASQLTAPDALMDLGTMAYGGTAGASNRDGRAANDAPGPHAITSTTKGPSGKLDFTYDDNGNLTNDRGLTYQWDEKDRLTGMTKTGTSATYRYDFNNSRKLKLVTDAQNKLQSTVHYIDKYSEVRDGKLIKYVYAGASRVARTSAINTGKAALIPDTYYHHDHLGSTNLASATTGNVTEQIVNYPFGRSRLAANANSINKSDYRFTGKERDVESDLQYFEARYLGVAGQFVSVDPISLSENHELIQFPQKLNNFSNSINNPIMYQDKSGKFVMTIALAKFGAAVGGAVGVLSTLKSAVSDIRGGKSISVRSFAKKLAVNTVKGVAIGGLSGAAVGAAADLAVAASAVVAASSALSAGAAFIGDVALTVGAIEATNKTLNKVKRWNKDPVGSARDKLFNSSVNKLPSTGKNMFKNLYDKAQSIPDKIHSAGTKMFNGEDNSQDLKGLERDGASVSTLGGVD